MHLALGDLAHEKTFLYYFTVFHTVSLELESKSVLYMAFMF